MEHSFLVNAVYYLAAAIIIVPLFRKLGLGAILGYLCAGALIGPAGLQLVNDPEHTLHFAEFGVVMLLFVIGLELNPQKLWQMRLHIGLLGGGQLLLSALCLALPLAMFTGLDWGVATLIGLTLALSSTAFAVQLMGEQGIMGSPLGRKGFAILLFQDMAVIPILLLVGILQADTGQLAQPWWVAPLAVFGVLLVGRFALIPLLRFVANSAIRELLTAAALLIVLGTALLMQATGLTMGMGAFLAGIILGNSSFRHQLEADIDPFKGLLLGLFFIAVGMSLDLHLLAAHPIKMVAGALTLILLKTLIIATLIRLAKYDWKEGFLLALLLSQGGEFAFVVMNKALAFGLIPAAMNNQVVLIVGLSMALTSPLVMLFQYMIKPKQPSESPRYDTEADIEPEVIIAGFGRFGQIVGRILAANQLNFTALDRDANHVEFVKQFGNKIFFGDATRADLLEAAGIDHARVLVIAIDDIEDSLSIARLVKTHFPKIEIIARAHNRAHAYQLYQCGIKTVIRETLESSLLAANHTLIQIGFTESQSLQMVDLFRKHDERLVRVASAHKDDAERLIQIANEGRKELEELFDKDHRL